jgi:hypothetical protein
LKKFLLLLLKIGIPLAILAFLVASAIGTKNDAGQNVFQQLVDQPKDWGLLAAACLVCAAAVTVTLIRWWCLVRALDIPLRLVDALRFGLLGYLFNLAPAGIVGGDLLKGWMVARNHHKDEDKVKAFASVLVDRIIGLYMLFVLASLAIYLMEIRQGSDKIKLICEITYCLTAVGAVFLTLLLTPGFTDGRGTRALGRLRHVGHTVTSLIDAVRMYRRKPLVLIVTALMSVGVHCLFASGIYLIARGLPGADLSLSMHFVAAPLSLSTGAIPLAAGPFEVVLEFLYTHLREPGITIQTGQGLVVALGYRMITLLIAAVGLCYYLGSRREVDQVMHQAEQEQQAEQERQAE